MTIYAHDYIHVHAGMRHWLGAFAKKEHKMILILYTTKIYHTTLHFITPHYTTLHYSTLH